ncbi:hypothetical protein GmRootV116_15720 [Variovorax sp. V116]
MAHGLLRQLAGVLELDGEFLAALAHLDGRLVELHGVVAFDLHAAVGSEGGGSGERSERQNGGGGEAAAKHGNGLQKKK